MLALQTILTNKEKAEIAIKNRLFVAGWLLNEKLHEIKNGQIAANVNLHYEDNIPVAVAIEILEDDYYDYKTMVFVRKSYRNKGIGSNLVKSLNANNNSPVGKGTDNSIKFWLKLGFKNIRHI
ncbi:MAG: GNAT family N-acetyltransferase [Silvanigrellaceae bacterium]|nr:GNAT family N-acetyltransferase [Silvanigrellaceae bacterium]